MAGGRDNHERLWTAIDAIAARHGLTPSGLARRAGLDPTTFNKSKRFTSDGRRRWPSTELIAKILMATGCDLLDLVRLVDARIARRLAEPQMVATGFPGFRDDGGTVDPPPGTRCFVVADHAMVPYYRKGDVLIVSNDAVPRPGDRVLIHVEGGTPQALVFLGREAEGVRVEPLGGGEGTVVAEASLASFARILWASQ